MKHGKRVVSLFMAVVIAVGSVCYRPASASAFAITSAVVSSATTAYLGSLGFEFAGMQSYYDGMSEAFETGFRNLEREFSESIELAHDEFQQVVIEGLEFLEEGYIKFSSASADMLNRFADWLCEKLCLVPGGSPMVLVPGISSTHSNYGGVVLQTIPLPEALPYVIVCDYNGNGSYQAYACNKPMIYSNGDFFTPDVCTVSSLIFSGGWINSNGWSMPQDRNSAIYVCFAAGEILWSNHDIKDKKGNVYVMGDSTMIPAEDISNPFLSVTIPSAYESPPAVAEQYAMVVDTGLTYADEQGFIDAVLAGAVAGTLAPTYTVTGTVAPPVEGEDEEENTQTGILSWTKKIWQSVQELPRTIADSVADVFVPSAEYMAAVPATIADTFADRTGFLTYPASLVYDFADRLSDGKQDFVLAWPTIYEPYSKAQLITAGKFNVSQFVRENDSVSTVYEIYQWVVKAYLTFLFLGLCKRKYNSVVGDKLGG